MNLREQSDLWIIVALLVGMVVFGLLGNGVAAILCVFGVGVVAFLAGSGAGPWGHA